MKIELENAAYKLIDQATWEQEKQGELKEILRDGKLLIDHSLAEIRERVRK
jgi:nicotinamide phosphoribosyltransferase